MEIGFKLKKIREDKKIAQQEIAEFLGISQKTYSNIESCKSNLSLKYLFKLSKYLEFDLLIMLQEQITFYNQKSSNNTIVKNEFTKKLISQYEAHIKGNEEIIKLLNEKIDRLERS